MDDIGKQADTNMQEIQAEMALSEVINDIHENNNTFPRLYSSVNFQQANVIVLMFDKFVGILEHNGNPSSGEVGYVAIGRSMDESLADGSLQLIDARAVSDINLFQEGVDAFVELLGDYTPTQEITNEDQINNDGIIEHIVEQWKLVGEMQNAVIH